MRKIAEIRADLKAKIAEVKAMDQKADAAAYEAAVGEIESLTRSLDDASKIEAAEQRIADKRIAEMEKENGRSFSMVKFFREAAEGRLSGLEAEVADMGAREHDRLGLSRKGFVIPSAYLRASAGQNYTTNADGGYLKVTQAPRYVDGLKERMVVSRLGATILGDLVGTVPIVSAGNFAGSWLAEGGVGTVTKIAFANASLTPHRNFVAGAVSKDLLRHTSVDVENILVNKLLDAHATLLESAAINGSGSSNQPTGIITALGSYNSGSQIIAMGTNGGAITWAKVVALETMVNAANANRGKLGYLTNAKVIGEMKSIERASNTARFILNDDGTLNGYPCEWTNLVPSNITKGTATTCSALIFGNFEDLYIGHWGGVDLVVDPFTLATTADIRFVLNSWDDAVVVEPKSFAVIKDITTA